MEEPMGMPNCVKCGHDVADHTQKQGDLPGECLVYTCSCGKYTPDPPKSNTITETSSAEPCDIRGSVKIDHSKRSFEIIDIIHHFKLSYCLGNAVHRILEEPMLLSELQNARYYLDQEIARIEASYKSGK